MLMLWQIDTGIMLIPSELFSRDLLSNILTRIIDHISSYYGVDAKAGIGSAYEYISELKKSFQEALNSKYHTLKVKVRKYSFTIISVSTRLSRK